MLAASNIGRKSGTSWLLRDVSLSVEPGQRLALVGPSGSGKTLLLRAFALLDPLDSGQLLFKSKPVIGNDIPRFRSQVIYLHQRAALLEGTVEDNLRQPFSLRVFQQRSFDEKFILEMLELLGRSRDFLNKQQRDLSGGESQLTALLRAIQLKPDILLLDEPTSALDAETTELVEKLIEQWFENKSNPGAFVWVTHDHVQASRVAQTIVQIRDGRLQGAV